LDLEIAVKKKKVPDYEGWIFPGWFAFILYNVFGNPSSRQVSVFALKNLKDKKGGRKKAHEDDVAERNKRAKMNDNPTADNETVGSSMDIVVSIFERDVTARECEVRAREHEVTTKIKIEKLSLLLASEQNMLANAYDLWKIMTANDAIKDPHNVHSVEYQIRKDNVDRIMRQINEIQVEKMRADTPANESACSSGSVSMSDGRDTPVRFI